MSTNEIHIHREAARSADLRSKVVAAAMTVHKALGPGFVESVYENALCVELKHREVEHRRQLPVQVHYDGVQVGEHRLDLLIDGKLIVELKAKSSIDVRAFAVVRSYLRATGLEDALILNFGQTTLQIKRVFPRSAGITNSWFSGFSLAF